MRKFAIAGVAVLAIAATTAVYAQHGWFHDRMMGQMRMSADDRAAMADAKIAAVHAGLKLTDDQEKLWPPVENAVRDLVKIRIDRAKQSYSFFGSACLSKNLSAMVPCVAAPPARKAAAMSDASTTSSRVAPAPCAAFACASKQ